jgi:hypothetical protein
MIAMAVLAVVMAAVISGLYSLDIAHRSNREMAKVREVAQVMSERIMGASWGNLGRKLTIPGSNGWSWHRRATPRAGPTAAVYLPLAEKPTTADLGETDTDSRDLQRLGILGEPSGVADLRVYVEYYNDQIVFNVGQRMATAGTQLHQAWNAEMGDARNVTPPAGLTALPENHDIFDLGTVDRAIVVRILVSWSSCAGGTRWHEILLARRK